jgi:ubiquinone/menaquinone biosynthesis C-methylase UbiE
MATRDQKLIWDDPKFANPTSSVEAVTKYFGQRMLEQAGLTIYPNGAPLSVFDNACGNGVVTTALHETMKDRPQDTYDVICGDFADAMVEATRQRITSENWTHTIVSKIDAQVSKTKQQ